MICLYFCPEDKREETLDRLIESECGRPQKILRTQNGKPYVEENRVQFSLSHSGGTCAIAVSENPVGVDTEAFLGKERGAVLASFCGKERAEITCERDFLMHWTAREAFVKYMGGTVWGYVKRLSFIGGRLYLDGETVKEQIVFHVTDRAVTALCAESAEYEIRKTL